MIKEYWNQIAQNRDVRQNLSLLRQEVKDKGKLKVLSSLVKGQEEQPGCFGRKMQRHGKMLRF